jgi:hypothetical protein
LQLFPEGGDLVSGMKSNVAFRALNEFDKPAAIEGEVVTGEGNAAAGESIFMNLQIPCRDSFAWIVITTL